MKFAGMLLSFLLFVGGMAFAQTNKYDAGQTIRHNQTIEGCLTHNTGSYQLVENNGTRHMLMGDSQVLSAHVGQTVKLMGAADYNRDASASGNNGMMSGQRFFRVDSVTEVSGSCHK
jgi:hypothetical protein